MMEQDSADAVGYIRESSRTRIKLHRRSQRDEVNDNRRLLPNATSSNPERVAEIANKLKTNSSMTVQELRDLKNALLECDENTEVVLNTHGALRGIVRELSGHHPEKQYQAAGCCCNLALRDGKGCLAVAKAAGPYLVTGLDSLNSEFQLTCIWALDNLSRDARARAVLRAQGAAQALARAAGAGAAGAGAAVEAGAGDAAAAALSHLVEGGISADRLPALVGSLSAAPLSAARARLWFALSCQDEFPLLDEVNETFLHKILSALLASARDVANSGKPPPDGEFLYLVRILANLCFTPPVCDVVVAWLVENDLGEAFKYALSASDETVRGSLMWLLGNLLNFSNDSVCKSALFNIVCS